MLLTLEIRWFGKGNIPETLQLWFRKLEGDISDQQVRTDFYLHMNDNDDLGIKVREGKIEIKKRNQNFGKLRLDSGLAGILEGWEKWGFNIAENSSDYENNSDPKSWIAVRKQRLLRKYNLTGHTIRPISPEAIVSEAFNLELSHIELMGQTCWSLNLEAYGGNKLNQEEFKRTSNYLFQNIPVVQVNNAISCGYPQWINEISNR
ncbi:MAG: hypothetical protein JW731_09565 [Bacteroidales bacterium]|nr:hypothetical protein [Bacteroidales bacterium]